MAAHGPRVFPARPRQETNHTMSARSDGARDGDGNRFSRQLGGNPAIRCVADVNRSLCPAESSTASSTSGPLLGHDL